MFFFKYTWQNALKAVNKSPAYIHIKCNTKSSYITNQFRKNNPVLTNEINLKYIINHKLLKISFELQTRSSKIFAIAQSDFTTLCSNWKIVKLQWQKQPAPRFFFQISRQKCILNSNIFWLNFSVSDRKLKNPLYCAERCHYVVPEQQKNR